MQRLILAAAFSLASGSVLATGLGITCDRPEYLQLKTADKAELQQEFCRTTRMQGANMEMHKDFQEGASKSRSEGRDASFSETHSESTLQAALSCSKAAAEYAGALQRRFKSKAPSVKVCTSPGKGI